MRWHKWGAVVMLMGALGMFADAAYMEAKAWLAQYLLDYAWQQRLADGQPHKPWPWADTSPVARLQFEAKGVEMVVLGGASGRNLAFAPAHLSASVAPGNVGVSVIGGHRDTHFSLLEDVRVGDEFYLDTTTRKGVIYQITEIHITDITKSEIRLDADHPMIALVSCYPFDALQAGGNLRYLVLAMEKQEEMTVAQAVSI